MEKAGGCDPVQAGEDPEPGMMSDMIVSGVVGEECLTHSDCVTEHAECVRGECECRRGFLPSSPLLCKEDPAPCSSSPCEGGGTCEEHDGTFTCYCTQGRLGKFCQERIGDTAVRVAAFSGQSFVRLRQVQSSVVRTDIRMRFRTFARSGLLLHSSEQGPGKEGDKLEISVVDYQIQLAYRLGGLSVIITSPEPILPGTWHRLHVQRYRGDGQLRVDGRDPVHGQAVGSRASLKLGNYSYVGGVPDSGAELVQGLEGCVKHLKLGLQPVSLVSSAEPLLLSSQGVGECGKHCRHSPCGHRGERISTDRQGGEH